MGTEAVLDPPPPQAVTTALNSTARLRWAISLDMVLTRLQEMGRNGIAIASARILLDNKAGCRAMVRQQWIFACCRMNPTAAVLRGRMHSHALFELIFRRSCVASRDPRI